MEKLNSKLLVNRFPNIAEEWHNNKNEDVNINTLSYGSKKKAWWICPKCDSDYESTVSNRTSGYNCPYCRGYKVNYTNSLVALYPNIAEKWHPILNEGLTPHEITKSYDKKVWWIGECGHNWDARTKDLINGSGCPYCANKRILIGFNDLSTTHPHIANLLFNPEDGHKYTHGSSKKVLFKCISCNEKIGEKHIRNVIAKGLNCPICKNTFSLPERIMINILKQLKVENSTEKSFEWSNGKRYDFFISDLNMIIETHGEQHYKNPYKNGRTLDEEIENDSFKEDLAKRNGIENYVIIDCERSDFNYIKKNISSSELASHFNLDGLDWADIFINSNTPTILKICELYNNENITQKEIADRLDISTSTVIRCLSNASSVGLCDYEPNSKRNKSISIKHMQKPVIQLTMDEEYIGEFESLAKAAFSLGRKHTSSLSHCCLGNLNSSGGYKWKFKSDYQYSDLVSE